MIKEEKIVHQSTILKQDNNRILLLNKLSEINDYLVLHKPGHERVSVFNSAAASLLFRLHYNRYFGMNDEVLQKDLLQFLEDVIGNKKPQYSYCNGLVGFGFFLNYLLEEEFIEVDNTLLNEIDRLAFRIGRHYFERNNHDLLHGGLGCMLYLIQRLEHNPEVNAFWEELLDALEACATTTIEGVFWKEDERELSEEEKGNVMINLNVSHGSAGKVYVLAKLLEQGVNPVKTKKLLQRSVDFMISRQDLSCHLIPTEIVNGIPAFQHQGWCRGNLAMSIVLWQAAEVLEDEELKNRAVSIGLTEARNKKSGLIEAGLCHGYTGLSQMYLRLYHYTGNQTFFQAHEYWLEKALKIEIKGGIAGYAHWDGGAEEWRIGTDLFSGVGGIGLHFISKLTKDMSWDRCFLLS